jgi:hypothetical protein
MKILAVDPNTYKFLIKKCAEDEASTEQKIKLEVNDSAVKNDSVTEEDNKDKVKDVVFEGLEKVEVKEVDEGEDGEEGEKNKAAAVSAKADRTVSPADEGKGTIKQESTSKGDRESEYLHLQFLMAYKILILPNPGVQCYFFAVNVLRASVIGGAA